jgi:hypothetical protein
MNRFGVSVIYFDAAGTELGFSLPLIIVSIIRRPLRHMMSLIGSEDSDSALGVQWACSRHPGPTPIRALPHSSEIRSSWPISPPTKPVTVFCWSQISTAVGKLALNRI